MKDQILVLMKELRSSWHYCRSLFLLLILSSGYFQKAYSEINNDTTFTVVFYNVENFFDCLNDSLTADDEYTPEGGRHWNYYKYLRKRNHIARSIICSGKWYPPDVVGICEIENLPTITDLVQNTGLRKFDYHIIHKESPDPRGIDVCMLYRSKYFHPYNYEYIPIKDKDGTLVRSREILFVQGTVNNGDTLHFFVNHWTSRYRGIQESAQLRMLVAKLIKDRIRSLQQKYNDPSVILMGDFNDTPQDLSIEKGLNAKPLGELKSANNDLINLSYNWCKSKIGTHKFHDSWSVFDQFIVTPAVIDKYIANPSDQARILKMDFLLQKDERYLGVKLNRTYLGYKYIGGYSDHLPVQLKLILTR
ncbi:endonuclease [Puteibacter caeruleilacunae]|nr:endonuclease [Puteibacter caeruleilacunae]